MTAASARVASAGESGSVFAAAIMAGIAYDAMRIMRLVGMEVVERRLAARWIRAMIPVARIVAIIDMAIKPARAVIPGAGSDEHPTQKPIGPIITIRRTFIRSVVEVAVGADRGHPNVDRYLCRRTRKPAQHGHSEN